MSDLARIKRRLSQFAEQEAGSSPLYAHLAGHAAADDEVAGLLAEAPESDATPTLLLAIAHRLLHAEPVHPLSRYYPSVGGFDGVDGQTWPLFREFLLERAAAARELARTRFTQTNEVQRAAVIYPAVALAAREAGGPIGLLEVGCSAGLLLGLDRYRYEYHCEGGEKFVAGPARTAVGLHCAVSGPFGRPPAKLAVAARLGLDRAPVDLADEDELAWLEACVWADQVDRIRLLRTAAAAQRKSPPELLSGDAVDDLPAAAARLPGELPLVVLTSHALVYLPPERRRAFVDALGSLAAQRPLWWVDNGLYEAGMNLVAPGRDEVSYARTGQSALALTRWDAGTPSARVLAQAHHHGRRMTWLG